MMHPCAPRLLFLLVLLLLPLGRLASSDVALLLEKVKPALQGQAASSTPNAQLATWNASSTPLCLWRGLRWSTPDGRPLRCDSAAKLSLFAADQDQALLTSIRLPAAALAGHLPPELGAFSALDSLYLAGNSLSGPIPLELGNAPALSALDLAGNALSGALPASLWNLCDRVRELRLHGNALSGAIPAPNNCTCDGLRVLDLGGNRFSGDFPSFVADFRGLQRLDLSYNNLSGQLPPALAARFTAESFLGNSPALCGPPLGQCVSLSSRGVAGLVIGLMAGAVVAASLCIGWAQKREGGGETEEEGSLVVFEGGEHLTLEEVLNATGRVVDKPSYCTVYKAKLAAGSVIELRLLREGRCCCKEKVVRRIGRARHDNLVPLRAFYQGRRGEKLLVYDYFPRTTTLHHLLHQSPPPLTWAQRHKIALGISRALAYLHAGQGEAHGNVRSSTVLVDHLFVPRLAEYALHRLLLPAAKADAAGYKAPELRTMKSCSARTDVYAFGILLLELLTGKKPSSSSPSGGGAGNDHLPSLVKAAVMEETALEGEVLDAELVKQREEGLLQALKLAMGCCAPVPAARPTMPEVVRQLEETRPRNQDSRSDAATPTTIS